jgi:hypothetical protein
VRTHLEQCQSYVCLTAKARATFLVEGDAFVIWIDLMPLGRFEDINRLFGPWPMRPAGCVIVAPDISQQPTYGLNSWGGSALHEGHNALIVKSMWRVGQT